MRVLLWGCILFDLAFLLHVMLWKIRLPKRQIRMLVLIFFGVLIIGILSLWSFPLPLKALGLSAPYALPEYIHIALFFISLTLAYVVTYSAIEVDSPSMMMVMQIDSAGPDGMEKVAFAKTMTNDILVKSRIKDLITAELTYMDGDKYKLTPKGVVLARIFIFYRKLLMNYSKGG
jgi:hypothetical protein